MPSSPRKSVSSPSLPRRNSAYIQVPAPSYSTPGQNMVESTAGASSSKENTPLQSNRNSKIMPSESISDIRKRKISDASHKNVDRSTRTEPSAKKAKLSEPSPESDHPNSRETAIGDTREDDFYCHQCNQKRPSSNGVQCTRKNARCSGGRCGAKYCRNCLRNRYNESLDDIKKRNISSLAKKYRDQHAVQDGYHYDCPRCRGVCNCSPCRRHRGLEPTGKFLPGSVFPVANSSAEGSEQKRPPPESTRKKSTSSPTTHTKDQSVKKSSASAPRPDGRKGSKTSHTSTQITAQARKSRAVPKARRAATTKPLARPVWTRIETSLDQSSAEARIYIREFVQRFSSVLDISKTHLDELEEIAGTTGEHGARNGDSDDEDIEGWVSEPCAKAVILGLLNVITSSADNLAIARLAKEPISDVRASGANLNKIWVALAALRDGLRRVPFSPFQYPDPLPPPASVSYRTTRHTHQADTDLFVGNSAQLIPVISALVESALHTKAIREEIERGIEQEKILARDVREAISRQKALFDEQKAKGKEKGSSKAEREQHKQVLEDIEHAHSVALANCIHRYAPAGYDHEGRIYYFLTPSEAEREAALQLIAGKDTRVKINRRRGGLTEEDRKAMRRWPWFVAIWGTLPEGAALAEADDEEADDGPRWWGFYEPEEIRKMAKWISASYEASAAKPQDSRSGVAGGKSRLLEVEAFGSSPASSRAPSPMSDISDDEDEEEEPESDDHEEDAITAYMRVDSQGRPVPTKKQLRGLVQTLRDYADLLQWRIRRAGGDHAGEEKNSVVGGVIPAKKFYR